MKKVLFTIIFNCILLLSVTASEAATLTVTKTADSDDGICNADCSLREAISSASSGDTIGFASPLFDSAQTLTLTFGEFVIEKTLIINGKGVKLTTISGNNAGRIFNVQTNGNLTLNGLTLRNGRATSTNAFGGAIYNIAILVINDSLISNNSANGANGPNSSAGGGIFNDTGGSLTLNNSVVSDNGFSGLSFSNFGAGIYNEAGGTVNITNSSISNNLGAAIRDNWGIGINNRGTLTITGSTISGNRANNTSLNTNDGGGIYNGGQLFLRNSTISGNTVSAGNFSHGGGIYNVFNQGSAVILNSTITQNSSVASFSSFGGGIYNGNSVLAVNTIIAGNTSARDSDLYRALNVNLNNFVGGDAQLGTLADNGGTTLTHSLLGGSPAINAGNICVLTANACGFTHPALTTDQRGAGFIRNFNTAVDIGAVEDSISVSPSTLPIGRKNVAYSQTLTASGGGGGSYIFGLESGSLPSGITLSTSGLISGTTSQEGTFNFAIRVTAPGGFIIKNYTLLIGYYVTNNNSSGAGSLRQLIADVAAGETIRFDPVFFGESRTISLDGTVLTINKNLTIAGPGSSIFAIDGQNSTRVFSVNNPLTLSGMRIIRGNGSGSVGGCILSNSTLNLTDVRVENCSSPSSGGGIFSNGTLNITNSTISNNTAIGSGGIFHGGGFTANLVNSTVSGNTATNGGAGGIGNGGTFNVYGSAFFGNTALFGGAATAGALMTINNSTLSGNLATTDKAGGVYVGVGERLEMTNTTVSNNVSNGNLTGGIYSDGGVIQMRNALVAGNRNGDGNAADVAGQILSFGWNMIGTTAGNSFSPSSPNLTGNRVNVPANLAPLGNYGGTTLTHALLPNSQAINNGDPGTSVFTTDQRGAARVIGSQDIGAFERNISFDQATLPNGTQNVPYSQNLTVTRLAGQLSEKNVSEENLAPFTFALISIAGQNLPNGLTLSSSGSISGTPTTAGSFTFTVMATDSDGMSGVAQYTLTIVNSPPTITPVTVLRLQGSPVSNSTIATVSDIQSDAGGVNVTVTSANPANSVTVSNIVNTNGTITADIVAACTAVSTTFTLTATDSGGASSTATLNVTVQSSPPNLVYATTPLIPYGGSTTVSPTTNTDNGVILQYQIISYGALTTAPTVNSAGVVSITNARPVGFHTIRVRATDQCASTTDADFVVSVDAVVSKTADTNDGVCDSDCSLREAVALADRVYFSPLFNTPQTIVLSSPIGTNRNVTIDGKGKFVTISGNNQTRIFQTARNGNLTLDSLTLTAGADFGAFGGGALFVENTSTASVINSTITNNYAENQGGGIYSFGNLTVRNSTITNNSAVQYGGGIISNNNSTLNLINSTITRNSYRSNGGNGAGVNSNNAVVNVRNTIIAGNFGNVPDFAGTLNSQGYNLIGNTVGTNIVGDTTGNILNTNARLTPLGNYGGATQMYALLADSPAINAGDPTYSSNLFGLTDQRGSQRLIGSRIDIGAFESNITFNQSSLPNANTLQVYNQQLSANRQTNLIESEPFLENSYLAPTSFAIVPIAGQSLPPGITLSSGGLLSGMPTAAGNYTFTVQATDTDGIAGVKEFTLQVFVPTAAMVSVSGRLVTANGEGIRNAVVNLTDMNGNARTVKTGSFGNYLFENVEAGAVYVVSVSSKRFTFERSSQILTVNENAVNIDFTAQE